MVAVGITVDGDLRKIMAAEVGDAASAVTRGIGAATDGLKGDLRGQVESAGLGRRLANAWRGERYPSRPGVTSLRAAGLVYSNAPDIIAAFDSGTPIRSKDGFFLAIPTAAAGGHGLSREAPAINQRRKKERLTPGGWERRTGIRLRFVYRRGRPSLLVADNVRVNSAGLAVRMPTPKRDPGNRIRKGQTTTVIFILVPQVQLGKRLDIDRAGQRWVGRLPELIVASWPGGRR
ncbi:DUF6441 family protein [Ancylobacter mangrovi]|uniref:DUF6441 family protein n=1 Tax=Ancylobacter mangrovi TaxID=2972472 RepID=UPI002163187E|nr:DUF6441 family protein [Ancylobacter mangrovi]MCS0501382.1 DUF6441 family protein [Ancylobacter mangrovi]